MYNVGILIWPNAEVLDFCGPFEVFRNTGDLSENEINVFIVAKTNEIVNCMGLQIKPNYTMEDCPNLDLLIIPGGNSQWAIKQDFILNWVSSQYPKVSHLLTVCTGALIIAKLGLITDGMIATTHQEGIPYLIDFSPNASIDPNARFTDNGKILTSGGISAGIDSSLYMVKKLWGEELANKVAVYMEYDWQIKTPVMKNPLSED
ncbi:MAG: DJ-1/PfpI family protein [Candidatus Heimdallarchaeota archaeon]|nr:DJ-1/PfpI family protein [Candidatus Heimdallarchaeota archaeon]MDH5644935.1 DJ-1/PfpI family protein [Candidatus Heimdallarchaeota archaeon]